MNKIIFSLVIFWVLSSNVLADNGLVKVASEHDVNTTTENLIRALESKGMSVFTRFNHAQAAKNNNMQLKPTNLVLFGNPKVGTLLMQCKQTTAIDLPQKALIYQDAQGQTWLTYNDVAYLNQRHGLSECKKVLKKVSDTLAFLARVATK